MGCELQELQSLRYQPQIRQNVYLQMTSLRLYKPLTIINMMFWLYMGSFQTLMIVLYGVFIRTTSVDLATSDYLSQSMLFLLGYVLTSIRYKLYDWTTITTLIFISAVSFQWSTLWYIFWSACVNRTFLATSQVTMGMLMVSCQATLCILVTMGQFLGKMTCLQMFMVSLVQIVGFCLNTVIQQQGIKAAMGGGGMTIFLFSAVFTLCMKMLNLQKFKGKDDSSYTSGTFKIIGLVILVYYWPSFNSMGSSLDSGNFDATANLVATSYFNTVLALSSAVISSLTLQNHGNRVNLHKFIQNIFSSGVLLSNCAGLIIDPFASLLIGVGAPLIAILYDKYGQIIFVKGEPEFLLLFSCLTAVLSSIFAAGRAARTPSLTSYPYSQGGLQLACFIVTIGFAAIFGCLAALLLRLFDGPKEVEYGSDSSLWTISPQTTQLYHGDQSPHRLAPQTKEQEWKQNLNFEVVDRPSSLLQS